MKKIGNKIYEECNNTFEHEGSTYLVKETKSIMCNGCALFGRPLCQQVMCIPEERPDAKWVQFKKVNKDLHL